MVYDAGLILKKKLPQYLLQVFIIMYYIRHLRMSYVQTKSQENDNVIVLMGGGGGPGEI